MLGYMSECVTYSARLVDTMMSFMLTHLFSNVFYRRDLGLCPLGQSNSRLLRLRRWKWMARRMRKMQYKARGLRWAGVEGEG